MTDHETNAELQPQIPDAAAECLIEFASLPWDSLAPGLRVKQVCRGSQRIRLLAMSEEFVEADWCTTGHIGYVIDGTLDIDFNGRLVRFNAGDGLCIPARDCCKHKARVLCGEALLFVMEHVEHAHAVSASDRSGGS